MENKPTQREGRLWGAVRPKIPRVSKNQLCSPVVLETDFTTTEGTLERKKAGREKFSTLSWDESLFLNETTGNGGE